MDVILLYIMPLILSILFLLELYSIYKNYSFHITFNVYKTTGRSGILIHLPALLYNIIMISWLLYPTIK